MSEDNLVLVVQRKLKASPERLFDAWTKPELMMQWFNGGESMKTPEAIADLKVGGRWSVTMHHLVTGKTFVNNGKYLVIEKPHQLVFTWHPMGQEDYETKVTLLFKKVSEEFTELTLTHEGLRDETDRSNHDKGWNGCLNTLTHWLAK